MTLASNDWRRDRSALIEQISKNGSEVDDTKELLNVLFRVVMPQSIFSVEESVAPNDADQLELNQLIANVPNIARELLKNRYTRKASFAHTYEGTPNKTRCWSLNHWMIRDNNLNVNVYVRSSDVLKVFPFNIYSYSFLWNLVRQEYNVKVCTHETLLESGFLSCFIASAHVYTKDVEQLSRS